jgi:predicted TIM-barrel fold metal-dependent hydrolase
MLIVDSQVHIWGADTPERPWPPGGAGRAQKPHPVSAAMMLADMDRAGVDRAVIVPPSWEGERNDLALEAVRLHPDRFAVMGRLPLERPESRERIVGWRDQPGMLGMRFTFHVNPHRAWLTDGTADWLWPALERAGIPVMVLVQDQIDLLAAIAARHPGLRLVIDHAGLILRSTGDTVTRGIAATCALARYPNVAVKASGMPSHSAGAYPFRDVHDPIRRLVDAFGPRRVFWGTDITRMPCSYRECVDLFVRELPWLAGEALELVMGRALCEYLGWPLPAAMR